ncbi:MAG TPA: hypothetical protein VNL98_07625 [Gemmatimonadales bacterium]|nr:hypothetical protein [Gemmatimonadales bacterium]
MGFIDTLTRRMNRALEEGRLRLDIAREHRRKDNAARELGYIAYRRTKGATPAEGEEEALIRKIAAAEAEIERLRVELEKVRSEEA